MRTRFFSNSIGIFEGGGVRAAAFAGAYAEASQAGVRFNGVAGTSAGSIIAALIAGGATPDFVLNELQNTTFTDLLATPTLTDRPYEISPKAASWGRFTPGNLGALAKVAHFSGLYSSQPIESWMEAMLKKLLMDDKPELAHRPVAFKDLKLPLFVVSTDVRRSSARIWSQQRTAEDSVAFAVRCSCSIPFFFQGVKGVGGSVFVDGGLISNLPSYLFADTDSSVGRFAERVLAFRLRASRENASRTFSDFQEYATSIADSVVAGATSIQLGLQANVFEIEIDTKDIRATDFNKINTEGQNTLIESGRQAVAKFIRLENHALSTSREKRLYEGYDEQMLSYVYLLQSASKSVCVVDSSSYFAFMIFPALLSAARKGVRLTFITCKSTDPREPPRRRMLQALGFHLEIVSCLPFTGLVKDIEEDDCRAAVASRGGTVGKDFLYGEGQTRVYSTADDPGVVDVLRSTIRTILGEGNCTPVLPPMFGTISENDLHDMFRKIPQYSSADISVERINLDENLQSMQLEIKEFKLLQCSDLIDAFEQEGVELFSPRTVQLGGGTFSLITPPVLEEVGGTLVLIEGHSRAYHCLANGIMSFKAVVVRGVTEPLPATAEKFRDARIASRTLPFENLFKKFAPERFRRIEEFLHE